MISKYPLPKMASYQRLSDYNQFMSHLSTNFKNSDIYRQACLSRDARFDGQFFIAVKTTGIYCRPICPAKTPKEENVEYFDYAHQASKAGYRPCLRCHPDSAPDSARWNGVNTTLKRAKNLIDDGALECGSLKDLSNRLGITDRYLRQVFDKHLGISPKAYALFKQCEFAKNLLHQTSLPITDIALASGFKSIRRFNDCFKKQFFLSPTDVRKKQVSAKSHIELKLYYRPPYNWLHLQRFFEARLIEGVEWSDQISYGRTYKWNDQTGKCKGRFTATHNEEKNRFDVKIEIDEIHQLKLVVNNIRRILDLDADSKTIEYSLEKSGFSNLCTGLRLPGTWSVYEAGIRAILGQQISVIAAIKLVKLVTHELGEKTNDGKVYFPTFKRMAESNFDFIKVPDSRKQTLINLAKHFQNADNPNIPSTWLALKGIGPWTVNYAKMRGLSDPDIYLGGDLGIKKAIQKTGAHVDPEKSAPFRSYLTIQLWNLL